MPPISNKIQGKKSANPTLLCPGLGPPAAASWGVKLLEVVVQGGWAAQSRLPGTSQPLPELSAAERQQEVLFTRGLPG